MSGIDIGPKIGIEGEKQFKDAIKAVNSQIKTTATQLKVLAAESGKSEDATRNLSQRQKVLGESLDANKAKVKTLTAQYERQKSELDKLGTALETARRENGEGSDQAIKAENAYSKQARAVNDLESQINTARAQVATISGELETNAVKLEEARSHAIKYGDAMQAAGDKLAGIGGTISKAGNALTLGITTPLLAAGTASVKFATDAETSFAKVGTILDSNVVSYDKLKSGVISASNESGIAVTDFNEALYSSVSAGVDSGKAIAFTGDMVKLAKGGFTDTAKAVDVVTTVLNAYGMEADQAEAISDKLITTQNLGKTTVDELASSMGKVIPTANSVNVGIDDVSAAMATLTKNGIATAEATTYYNSMLNELGKSGSTADKALKEISGKSFKELVAEGKPVTDILQLLSDNAANSGLSLSDMFGSAEASKAALTIMKGNGDEYNSILQQMKDSAGATQTAFEKMDSTPAAKMQKELNKLKNAGIETGSKLLPLVTKAVSGAGKLLDVYNDLDDGTKDLILRTAGIAAASGPVLKIAGTATTGVGKLTSGVGKLAKDLGKLSAAKKGAQAIGEVGSKAVQSVEGVSGFSKALIKLASPGGIALLAAGAVVGIGAAFLKARDDAVKADMAKRFGEVKLSADEAKKVVDKLTTTKWTMQLNLYSDAKEKLDDTLKAFESAKRNLEKETWKVSLGLALDADDITGYKDAIDSYIQSAIDTVEQANYTAQVSINAVLRPGTDANIAVANYSSNFYSTAQGELDKLGKELAKIVDESLGDGVLTNEELININEIQSRMQAIMDKIADRQYKVELKKLEIGADEKSISVESFRELMDKAQKALQERSDSLLSLTAETTLTLEEMHMDKTITDAEYGKWLNQMQSYLLEQKIELLSPTIDLGIGTIETNYNDVIPKLKDDFEKNLTETFKQINIDPGSDAYGWFNTLYLDFQDNFLVLDEEAKRGINSLVAELKPEKEQLESIRDEYIRLGMAPPQAVTQGLGDIYELEQMSGAGEHILELMAQTIAESPEKQEVITQSIKSGQEIPEELAQALLDNYGIVIDAETGMFDVVKQATFASQEEAVEFLNDAGGKLSSAFAESIAEQYGLLYENGKYMVGQVSKSAVDETEPTANSMTEFVNTITDAMTTAFTNKGEEVDASVSALIGKIKTGVTVTQDELNAAFSALGWDLPQSLISSLSSMESATQTQAISLLTQLSKAEESKRPALKEQLESLGIAVDDSLIAGLNKNQKNVESKSEDVGEAVDEHTAKGIQDNEDIVDDASEAAANSAIDAMNSVIEKTKLSAPGMSTPDWTAEAASGLKGMQEYLYNNPLTVKVNQVTGSIAEHAAGGIFNVPHVAIVAEEAPGEAIIPLAASRRADAIGIWMETGRRLGMEAYESMVSAGHSLGSARSRAQAVRQKSSPSPSIVFEKDAVVIHTQAQDADEIYRTFKRRLDYDVSKEVRSRGSLT